MFDTSVQSDSGVGSQPSSQPNLTCRRRWWNLKGLSSLRSHRKRKGCCRGWVEKNLRSTLLVCLFLSFKHHPYTQIPLPQLQRHSLKPPHHGHHGHHSRCRQSPRAGRHHREQCKVGKIDILWARRSGVMTNDFLGKYLYIFHSPGHSDIRTCSEEIQIFLVSQWFESWFSLVVYHGLPF